MNTQNNMQHDNGARESLEQARRDFRDAMVASGAILTASILGHEVLQKVLPESSFAEATSNTVLTLGGVATATIAAAGSVSALLWRRDAIRRQSLRQASENSH